MQHVFAFQWSAAEILFLVPFDCEVKGTAGHYCLNAVIAEGPMSQPGVPVTGKQVQTRWYYSKVQPVSHLSKLSGYTGYRLGVCFQITTTHQECKHLI